jgi:chromosome segregation ATPase
LTKDNEKLSLEKESFRLKLTESEDKIAKINKKAGSENEGLYEKIKILQNTLDKYSQKTKENDENKTKLEEEISQLKLELSDVKGKHDNIVYEMEINYKNMKNNFILEKTIKDLTEENDKLIKQIKNLQSHEDFKIKFLQMEKYAKEIEEKLSLNKSIIDNLSNENKKLSSENFEKFQKINSLEGEIKIKLHKIEEYEKDSIICKRKIEELETKTKNFEYMIKTINVNNENQIKELKKEIDKLVKINDINKKDIISYKTQIEVINKKYFLNFFQNFFNLI